MDESSSGSFVSDEEEKPKLMESIMIQKLDKKGITDLGLEIKNRKNIFYHYILNNFGPNFIKIKPESYNDLVDKCKTFYFSPESQFLNNFPKLRNRILKERQINYNKLLSKINVGSLLYLSEARKKKKLDQNDQKNERLMAFSKNFASQDTKDVISTEIYKVKFWKKNAKKINKVLKNKFKNIFANLIIKTNEQENQVDEKEKENLTFLNKFNNKVDNLENIKENTRYNPIFTYYNNIQKLKNENNKKDIYDLETNENIKGSYTSNINSLKDYSFPSIINKTNYPKSSSNEIEKMYNLKTINPIISRNKKIFDIKKNSGSLLKSTIKTTFFNSNSSSVKYKKNIKNKVSELNSQTYLCNMKLYNLITRNKTVLPGKILKNSDKDFDINYALSESSKNPSKWKKNHQSTFSYLTDEKLNATISKSIKGEKIDIIVKEAKNNMTIENKLLKREMKLFPKKLKNMPDDFALQMVDKLYPKNKLEKYIMPEMKETLKEKKERREHQFSNDLRNKAKNNHNKIIRLAFYLEQDKEKFYKNNNDILNKIKK